MQAWSKVSRMEPAGIKVMQDSLLEKFVREEASQRIPFYVKKFKENNIDSEQIKGTDDLVKLPFTTKEDMLPTEDNRFKPKEFVIEESTEIPVASEKKSGFLAKLFKKNKESDTDGNLYKLLQLYYTSGRTGPIVPLTFTLHDINNLKEMAFRSMDVWGLTRDDTIINALSYGPHISFWQTFYGTVESGATALQTGGGRVLGIEKILRALFNLEAPVLVTFPGYADFSLEILSKFGYPMPSLEMIILGMDDSSPQVIEKIKKRMEKVGAKDNRIRRGYYISEVKGGWPECNPGTGYHIHPDHVFVEIIDPVTGERKGENEPGEIVITNLDAKGTALIRFRTGDIATGGITTKPCPECKRTVPRILGDIDRRSYYYNLDTSGGQQDFNFNQLRRSLFGVEGLGQWYTEIIEDEDEKGEKIRVIASPTNDTEEEALLPLIENAIKDSTGVPYEILFSTMEDVIQKQGMEKRVTECRIFDMRNA